MALVAGVAQALEELRAEYGADTVTAREDGEGGAYVIVDGVELGAPYAQEETWIGFRITFSYPYADVYPHYVRGDLARIDGAPLGEGTSPTMFEGRAAIQLSRRSPRRDPARETARIKLAKVLAWLRFR